MSTIRVPLDFSECAPNVVAEALRFARAFGAGLLVLHASETPRGLPLTATVQPPGWSGPLTVEALLRGDADALLAPRGRWGCARTGSSPSARSPRPSSMWRRARGPR